MTVCVFALVVVIAPGQGAGGFKTVCAFCAHSHGCWWLLRAGADPLFSLPCFMLAAVPMPAVLVEAGLVGSMPANTPTTMVVWGWGTR